MKKKFFNIIMFFIIAMFVSGTTVFANESVTIKRGNFLYYHNGEFKNPSANPSFTPEDPLKYPILVHKYSDDGRAFICETGMNIDPPAHGDTCTGGEIKDEPGVAYLINHYINLTSDKSFEERYYLLELAVLSHLDNRKLKIGDVEINEATLYDKLGSNFKTLVETADKIKKSESKVNISLSHSNLEFTYNNGDGYYYSQKVYITDVNKNVDSFEIELPENSSFELINHTTEKKPYFQLKINKSKILGKKLNVSVDVTGKNEYYTVNYYECGDKQNLYSTVINSEPKTGTATIKGEISSTQLTIKKLDEKDKFLPGVTIKVENEDKSYSKTLTTTDKEVVLENLAYGKYTITEVSSPEGYTLLKEPQTVTLSKDNLSATVTFKNSLTKVEISKLDYKSGDFLPGALLQIQDKEGNVVKDKSGKEYEWVSTNQVYVIDGLPVGTYYLVEKSSPDKYVLNGKKVEFKVTNDSKETKVVMTNKLNKVKISKINIVDKKELKGATLEIQDKEGNVVKYCTDSKGKENTECKWVSTDKPYEIEGMPNGTYYLVETLAPEGYVLNKEKIEFVVDGKELIVEVEMENELEVKVPDTLSSRSTLLIAISMFDIALGIGILTYVKKNKAEE